MMINTHLWLWFYRTENRTQFRVHIHRPLQWHWHINWMWERPVHILEFPIVNKRVSVIIMNNDQLEICQLWLYSQIYVIKFEYLQLVLMHQLIDLPVVTTGQKTSNLRKTRKWRNSDSSSKKDRIYSGFEFVKTKNNVHKVENQTIKKNACGFEQ